MRVQCQTIMHRITPLAYPNPSDAISEGTNTTRHWIGLLTGYLNNHWHAS
jgi:hypothetical protein